MEKLLKLIDVLEVQGQRELEKAEELAELGDEPGGLVHATRAETIFEVLGLVNRIYSGEDVDPQKTLFSKQSWGFDPGVGTPGGGVWN